jgi:hypothetical protein
MLKIQPGADWPGTVYAIESYQLTETSMLSHIHAFSLAICPGMLCL